MRRAAAYLCLALAGPGIGLGGCARKGAEAEPDPGAASAAGSETGAAGEPIELPPGDSAEVARVEGDEILVLARARNHTPERGNRVPVVAACHAAVYATENGYRGVRLVNQGGLRRKPFGEDGVIDEIGQFHFQMLAEVRGVQTPASDTIEKCREEWGIL